MLTFTPCVCECVSACLKHQMNLTLINYSKGKLSKIFKTRDFVSIRTITYSYIRHFRMWCRQRTYDWNFRGIWVLPFYKSTKTRWFFEWVPCTLPRYMTAEWDLTQCNSSSSSSNSTARYIYSTMRWARDYSTVYTVHASGVKETAGETNNKSFLFHSSNSFSKSHVHRMREHCVYAVSMPCQNANVCENSKC